jgi:protein O-GlcNAc transferase
MRWRKSRDGTALIRDKIMSDTAQTLNAAISALNSRDLKRAEELFRNVIKTDESHIAALNLLVVVLISMQRFYEAESFIARATLLDQQSDVSFYNYGLISKHLNKPQEALEHFSKAIALNRNVAETWNNRGAVFNDLNKYDLAIADFDDAIKINGQYSEAYANKGKSLAQLKRYDEAFVAYDKALSIKPGLVEAWLGRGNVFCDLRRYDEAFSAYDKALSIRPNLAETWLGRGNVLWNLQRHDAALAAYDKALSLKSDLVNAWVGRGNVFRDLRRYDDASAAYDKALSIKPNLEAAWLGRGNVFCDLGRYDEAFAVYDKALSIKPDLTEAWLGRANAFSNVQRYDEAFAAYDKALSIQPDLEGVEGERLHTKMHLCNWDRLDIEISDLTSSVRNGKANCAPFALLSLTDSPEDCLRCTSTWVAAKYRHALPSIWRRQGYAHDKIRIGYVSGDLHQHATAYLMADLFECHNRTKFTTTAFSFGPNDNSSMRQRLVASFDTFVDFRSFSDAEAARRIAEAEIDILVDLKGFTQEARTNIFAHRPAPIQVNYLGYPGTMAAPFIDYIIGDTLIFTLRESAAYSEKLVQLPHSYQPNGRTRRISDKSLERGKYGLSKDHFVFCCFNNNYKISPSVFESWTRILKMVNGSVLWLLAENQVVMANLRKEIASRGIDPARLVFANRMELADHLARHRLADIFVDTFPYNAHTTASDALWAGLPVVTLIGRTFAGRVASSLLNAIGLPELITHSRGEYEALAIDLALNKEKLQSIRKKLARNRLTTPLFDTPLYTAHLEAAYEAMYRRYQVGLPPQDIEIRSFV